MSTSQTINTAGLPTTQEVALTLLQWLFATIGTPTDYNIGSIVRTYSEAIGSVVETEGIIAQSQALQALVTSAYAAFGVSPKGATGAVGSVIFSTLSGTVLPSGVSVQIPTGTVVQTPGSIQFSTTSSATMISGTAVVSIPIQAVTLGATSNVPANTITQILTGLSYPLTVNNPSATAGGSNAELPAQTLSRFLAYVQSLGLCSPISVASSVIGQSYLQETVQYSSCFDDQTEILTNNGWYKFEDLPWNSKIATLNPETHELEYQDIEKYHKYWYEGRLTTINNKVLDIAVTPDHSMYVRSASCHNKESNWKFIMAKDLRHTQSLKRNCKWEGKEEGFYTVGDHKISMDLWLEFLGYYLSEGSSGAYKMTRKNRGECNIIGSCNRSYCGYHNTNEVHSKPNEDYTQYSIDIYQNKGYNKSKIEECLRKLPFTIFNTNRGFSIRNKQLCSELSVFGKSNYKYIPEYIKNLSSRQLRIILDALTLGDGMVRDSKGKKEWKYFTSSKRLADDVQEIVLKCGLASSIKTIDNRGKEIFIKGRGITGKVNYLQYIVCIHRDTLTPQIINSISYVDYKGFVYCVTVPNHIIYVRRNGKTVFAGNCVENWITQVQNNQTPVPGFTCYDNNTEVLTEEGWYKFEDLPWNSKIATLNPETHELEYQDIEKYHKYKYKGKLIKLESDSYNLAVTPDHNMYICPDIKKRRDIGTVEYVNDPNNWMLQKADLVSKYSKIKTNCKWSGIEQDYHIISGVVNHRSKSYKINMDLWLEFLGYYLSEGSCADYISTDKNDGHGAARHRRVTITQFKDEGIRAMEKCLLQFPMKFHRDKAGWVANDKLLYEEINVFGLCNEKFVPNYVKNLTARQIKIFLDALFIGDGTFNKDGTYKSLATTSKILADDVQELLLKIGLVGTIIYSTDHIGKPHIIYNKNTGTNNIITSKLPSYTVSVRNNRFNTSLYYGSKTLIDYDDLVYCVTVPNHIIYVKRNGKGSWCGNCYIDNGSGSASTNLINLVNTFLSNGSPPSFQPAGTPIGFRPAGVPFSVAAVSPIYCNVVVTGAAINTSLDSILQTAITQSITSYFSSLGFSTTAQLTQLTAAIANASIGQLSSLSVSLYINGNSTPQQTIPAGLGQRVILTGSSVVIQ